MTFTELADTRQNITSALLELDMVKYFAKWCKTDEILDYCDAVAQALEEARDQLQNEIDNILKAEGYNNDNM